MNINNSSSSNFEPHFVRGHQLLGCFTQALEGFWAGSLSLSYITNVRFYLFIFSNHLFMLTSSSLCWSFSCKRSNKWLSVKNWSLRSYSNQIISLPQLIQLCMHDMFPLHACNTNERLISPQVYHIHLQGAIAHVHFMLFYTSFSNFNNFTVDMHSI